MAINDVQSLQIDEYSEENIISYYKISARTVPSREILEHLFIPPHPAAAKEYRDAQTNPEWQGRDGAYGSGRAALD
ncbi:MAG TPA: hypothetical protein VFF98_06255 [Novosphingobium sp.]|nr:hypothetical protein [Novosphingobium sp.]